VGLGINKAWHKQMIGQGQGLLWAVSSFKGRQPVHGDNFSAAESDTTVKKALGLFKATSGRVAASQQSLGLNQ
jgi:hypothetical protein